MTRTIHLRCATLLVAGLMGLWAPRAMAMVIVVTPDAGLSANPAALAAFNRAAQAWSSKFTNNITINIDARLTGGFAPNHIGNASSVMLAAPYTFFRDRMVASAATEADDGIVAFLPTLNQFSATLPSGVTVRKADNGINFSATKANFKALGYMDFIDLDVRHGPTDATLTFNNAFVFDYDNRNGVSAGMVDFETVVAHEIGHALGFVSAVDGVDIMKNNGTGGFTAITPLDLFRFRDGVAGQDPTVPAEFTSFPRFLDTGGVAIFDDLLSETSLGTGQLTGDGDEASHWKNDDITGQLIGTMDGSIYGGQLHPITAADLRALDLIGYHYYVNVASVPEPSSALLLACGACGAGFFRRRSSSPQCSPSRHSALFRASSRQRRRPRLGGRLIRMRPEP